MCRRTPFMTLLIAALLAGASAVAAAQVRPCPAADSSSQKLRTFAVNLITLSSWTNTRTGLGITTGDTSSVAIVTADSVCEALTAANDSATSTTSVHALRVIAFQTFFLAVDSDVPSDKAPIYFFDNAYVFKGAIFEP